MSEYEKIGAEIKREEYKLANYKNFLEDLKKNVEKYVDPKAKKSKSKEYQEQLSQFKTQLSTFSADKKNHFVKDLEPGALALEDWSVESLCSEFQLTGNIAKELIETCEDLAIKRRNLPTNADDVKAARELAKKGDGDAPPVEEDQSGIILNEKYNNSEKMYLGAVKEQGTNAATIERNLDLVQTSYQTFHSRHGWYAGARTRIRDSVKDIKEAADEKQTVNFDNAEPSGVFKDTFNHKDRFFVKKCKKDGTDIEKKHCEALLEITKAYADLRMKHEVTELAGAVHLATMSKVEKAIEFYSKNLEEIRKNETNMRSVRGSEILFRAGAPEI